MLIASVGADIDIVSDGSSSDVINLITPQVILSNNTIGTTNSTIFSDIWVTNEGNMDNVPDLYSTLDSRYVEVAGDQMTGQLNISTTLDQENHPTLNVVSRNPSESAVWITGNETAKGSLKITHTKPEGNDSTSAALSIDLQGTGTEAQGLFIDGDSGGSSLIHVTGLTQNLLTLFNQGLFVFTNYTLTHTSPFAFLIEDSIGTDIFRVDTDTDLVFTGKIIPRSDNAFDFGDSTRRWNDLTMAGILNSSGLAYLTDTLILANLSDTSSNKIATLIGNDRAIGNSAPNDEAYMSFYLDDDGGNSVEYGRINWIAEDDTIITHDGAFSFDVAVGGASPTEQARVNGEGFGVGITPTVKLHVNEDTDAASNEVVRIIGNDRVGGVTNDEAYMSFYLDDHLGNTREVGRMTWITTDSDAANIDGAFSFDVAVSGSLTERFRVGETEITAGEDVDMQSNGILFDNVVPSQAQGIVVRPDASLGGLEVQLVTSQTAGGVIFSAQSTGDSPRIYAEHLGAWGSSNDHLNLGYSRHTGSWNAVDKYINFSADDYIRYFETGGYFGFSDDILFLNTSEDRGFRYEDYDGTGQRLFMRIAPQTHTIQLLNRGELGNFEIHANRGAGQNEDFIVMNLTYNNVTTFTNQTFKGDVYVDGNLTVYGNIVTSGCIIYNGGSLGACV